MSLFRGRAWVCVLTGVLAHAAFGGSLQDREQDIKERSAAKTEKKNAVPDTQQETARSALGSPAYAPSREGQSFLGGFWSWLVAAPFQYRHDDPSARMSSDEAEWTDGRRPALYLPHVPGQGTVPYVRLDYNRQFTDWDPDDVRLELGYKLVAFHGRMTRYTDEVGDELDLRQYYGVLRYGARFVQLRGGYRWLWDNGMVDAQSGPYAGLSFSF